VALAIGAHRPTWAAVIPALLAVEVVATGLAGQHEWAILAARSSRVDALGQPSWLSPMVEANIDAASYLRPDSNVDVLQEAGTIRYLSIAPEIADRRGYLVNQRAKNWGLEANQRAILFGIEDAQGYNPIQLRRYWEFVRTVSAVTVAYNAAFFEPVTPAVMDLMHVGYVITQQGQAVEPGSVPASRVGEWVLWRRQDVPPRASVVSSMVTVAGPEQALERVSAPGFDPSATAVVERSYQDVVLDALPRAEPGSSRTEGSGTRRESTARYVSRGSQAARVEVEASAPSLLVVRNPYDRHWRATVDGRPAPLIPVDHLLQGVPVLAGRHVVELAYDDPWVGYGLAGSAVSLGVLMGAAGVLQRRRSAPKGPPPQPPD
jgi:hypothetical protein